MKHLITMLLLASTLTVFGQDKQQKTAPEGKPLRIVDASCGQCKLGLKGKSCDLAVRIDGKAYFVKGTDIDAHGDAHAGDGFCNAVRKAEVRGEIRDGFFVASYFRLLPENTKKK